MSGRLSRFRKPGPLVLITVGYFAAVTAIMIWRGISVEGEYLMLLLIPIALFSGRFFRFISDWGAFLVLFLAWEALRDVAPKAGFPIHVADLASVEKWLFFGHIPSQILQSTIHTSAVGGFFDYAATIVYFCHFAFPVAIGLVLWTTRRTQFLRYVVALLGMSCVAFIVFVIFPTAPPWMAAGGAAAPYTYHVISGVQELIAPTLGSAQTPYYNLLFHGIGSDQIAAFPSLHAAFPLLGFFAIRPLFKKTSYFVLAWCFVVWFSVVYLGEHYAADVIGGIVFAVVSWWILMRFVVPRVPALQHAKPSIPDEQVETGNAR